METPEASEWTGIDAWVLAATSTRKRRGCTLSSMIGELDLLNHAIPSREELSAALGALIASGLVVAEDGRFRTTEAGKVVRKHWRGGIFRWGETMLPVLASIPRTAAEYPLPQEQFDDACQAYSARVARFLR